MGEIGERWYKRPEKQTLTIRGAFSTLKRKHLEKNKPEAVQNTGSPSPAVWV